MKMLSGNFNTYREQQTPAAAAIKSSRMLMANMLQAKPNTMFNTYTQKQKSASKNTPKGDRVSGKKGVSRIAMKENV